MASNITQIEAKSVYKKPQCPYYMLIPEDSYIDSQPDVHPTEALITLPTAFNYILGNLDYDTDGFHFHVFDKTNPFFDCVKYDLKQAKMLSRHLNDYYFLWRCPYGRLLPLSSQRLSSFCQKYHLKKIPKLMNNQQTKEFISKTNRTHLFYNIRFNLKIIRKS